MPVVTNLVGPFERRVERGDGDRRQGGERRRRQVPVAVDRRWVTDRRRGQRRDGLTARLARYWG